MCSTTPLVNKSVLEYAQQKLGETNELRENCVTEISDWLDLCKSEFNANTDDAWILLFLRANKFNVDKTKKKIKNHLILRAKIPEWYINRDPLIPELREILKLGVFLPLRQPDNEGRLVILCRFGSYIPNIHDTNYVIKVFLMVLDAVITEMGPEAIIYGIVMIGDMRHLTFRHMARITPFILRKLIAVCQNYCLRPQRIDLFYSPLYFNIVINVLKQFLSKKIKERIYIHKINLNIEDVVPRDILPDEYGGTAGTLTDLIYYWKGKCIDLRDWFKADEEFRAYLK